MNLESQISINMININVIEKFFVRKFAYLLEIFG